VEAKLSWERGDKVYMQNFVEKILKENHKRKMKHHMKLNLRELC
jgi:hypothetical protein